MGALIRDSSRTRYDFIESSRVCKATGQYISYVADNIVAIQDGFDVCRERGVPILEERIVVTVRI